MQLSLQLILVASVTLLTAVIVMFMVQSGLGGVGDFVTQQQDKAECKTNENVDCPGEEGGVENPLQSAYVSQQPVSEGPGG